MPHRFSPDDVKRVLKAAPSQRDSVPHVTSTDVVIAGSGPIACAYARTILEKNHHVRVTMVEIGSQDDPIVGAHHKNSIKYQKDIDAFVNVIKGALQPISAPPAETYISTLGGDAWRPSPQDTLIFQGSNPDQKADLNLKASAVTRTVGGMATHWTCACPFPDAEERKNNPIPKDEFEQLLHRSHKLLNVHSHEYDHSIRHQVVRDTLLSKLPKDRHVQNLPLGVKRRHDNPLYVTWTGSNTVLGEAVHDKRFRLLSETRVSRVLPDLENPKRVAAVMVRDLKNNNDIIIFCHAAVIACGAIGTPQVLAASAIYPEPLGKYLCEQSIAFCQIVLRKEIVDAIWKNPEFKEKVEAHHKRYPRDPLPIPFSDPEPQVMIPFTPGAPWHCQVHRDAFSYGDVGPRADSRIVVDLRWFGRQEIKKENRVHFGEKIEPFTWFPGVTDIYGMPQATFEVQRSAKDDEKDQEMMRDMCNVASYLGAYLPGSNPQFMDPGLALHITGTTRIGKDPATSVADAHSKVHEFENLYVGGNGCIPDSTGCNPTLTSVAIAIKGAEHIAASLEASKKHHHHQH